MNYELQQQHENDTKGLIVSVVVHALLLLILILVSFTHLDPPPLPQNGIVLVFEQIESNVQSEDNSALGAESSKPNEAAPDESGKNESPISSAASNKPVPSSEKRNPIEESSILKASKETEKRKEEEAAKVKREANEKAASVAKKKAEDEARAKAEYEASKKKYSDLLGKGKSNSSNSNGETESGNPNSSSLEGLVKGNGKVGEGLTGRKVIKEPKITDNSQKAGKVVIKVCIDKNGSVIEANYTQRGSTTTDSHLVSVAEQGAKKYIFAPSDVEKQCGSIIIDFILE